MQQLQDCFKKKFMNINISPFYLKEKDGKFISYISNIIQDYIDLFLEYIFKCLF